MTFIQNIPRWIWIAVGVIVIFSVSYIVYNAYNKKVSPSTLGGATQRTSLADLEEKSTQPQNVFDYAHAIID